MTATLPRLPRRAPRRQRAAKPAGDVGKHLARAAALRAHIDELTAQYDTERHWLQTYLESKGLTKVELGSVRVVLRARNSWTYSAETQREMQALAVTQKWEQRPQDDGTTIATNNPTYYVALTFSDS